MTSERPSFRVRPFEFRGFPGEIKSCLPHFELLNYEFSALRKSRPLGAESSERNFDVSTQRSYVAKPGELQQKWWLVDASDKIVGRLASDIAMVLMGKHRPTYTPHVDTGDFVIVVNAEKVKFTGRKWDDKTYAWFTGYTRQRVESAGSRRARRPTDILREAVRRMLPKNKLARRMLEKLKIYVGPEHHHQAQRPEPKDMGSN